MIATRSPGRTPLATSQWANRDAGWIACPPVDALVGDVQPVTVGMGRVLGQLRHARHCRDCPQVVKQRQILCIACRTWTLE
jgi:hypothetical protein